MPWETSLSLVTPKTLEESLPPVPIRDGQSETGTHRLLDRFQPTASPDSVTRDSEPWSARECPSSDANWCRLMAREITRGSRGLAWQKSHSALEAPGFQGLARNRPEQRLIARIGQPAPHGARALASIVNERRGRRSPGPAESTRRSGDSAPSSTTPCSDGSRQSRARPRRCAPIGSKRSSARQSRPP